ncbi:hypothetical protein OIU77_005969 [Salix suchowensis]|uniref:ATP synthase F0 subunit 8 n=1 Tax=Salix suchowensis TaxID=1278906 RepID=A0ABQ9ATF9_9ROSI|nr:hypothetical protein OIU77_005969 [Salix suchowensis]
MESVFCLIMFVKTITFFRLNWMGMEGTLSSKMAFSSLFLLDKDNDVKDTASLSRAPNTFLPFRRFSSLSPDSPLSSFPRNGSTWLALIFCGLFYFLWKFVLSKRPLNKLYYFFQIEKKKKKKLPETKVPNKLHVGL